MNPKNKTLWVGGFSSFLTLLLFVFADTSEYTRGGLLISWAFFTWNFYAFGFDRDMWPWIFVELDGQGKGNPLAREVVFWITAFLYFMLLATIAWAPGTPAR